MFNAGLPETIRIVRVLVEACRAAGYQPEADQGEALLYCLESHCLQQINGKSLEEADRECPS